MSSEQDIRNELFKRQTGSAPNFRAIDGVGPKTAEKVKGTIIEGEGRVQAPADVQDLTDDQLAEKADISENRARKVIKGAGGNPDRKPRSTTGSVSAAGIKMPQGEFVTEVSDQDNAEAKFSTSLNRGIGRSQEAAAADKGKRAPVTTDYERWKKNKGELDFPGVDTPTDDPQVLPKDLRQKQRPATTDPPDPPTPRQDDTGSAAGPLSSTLGVSPEVQESDPTRSFEDELIDPGERRAAGGRRGNVPQGFVDNLAAGRDADLAFTEAESERGGALDSGTSDQRERDPVSENENRSLVTEYGGIPPQNPTTELPGVGESTADKLESEKGISSVQEFYQNSGEAGSLLSKQFRKEARTVAAYSVGAVDNPAGGREADPAFTEAESERGDDGSTFSPDRDEREAIRKLERNSPGREAEQIEKVRLFDDPPEDALETFGDAADRVVNNRDEITDTDRTDTSFLESDTIDTIDRLRSEVR